MDEHASQDLHYGSLGAVSYNADTTTWSCQKFPVHCPPLHVIQQDFFIAGHASDINNAGNVPTKGSNDTERRLRTMPEFAGAVSLVQDIVKLDAHTEPARGGHRDDLVGGLLAFGAAYTPGSTTSRPVPFVAYSAGEDGDWLCIAALISTKTSFATLDKPQVFGTADTLRPVPSPSPNWRCPSGRILQVVSSQPKEQNYSLLAARSSTHVYLFRPIPTYASARAIHEHRHLHAHVIAANQIAGVRISGSLGSSCTDVAFNTWFQRQFILVDDTGAFVIFELAQKKVLGPYGNKIISRGTASADEDGDSSHPPSKCIHRAIWLHDVHTFIISAKHRVSAFDVRNCTVYLATLDLSEEIADIRTSPFNHDEFFILTSAHIVWAGIISGSVNDLKIKRISTWKHYFDPAGANLRLAFRKLERAASGSVILYSQQSCLMAEYFVGNTIDPDHQPWIVANASSVRMSAADGVKLPEQILSVHLNQIPFCRPNLDLAEESFSLFQMFVLTRDLSVTGFVCCKQEISEDVVAMLPIEGDRHRGRRVTQPFIKDDWLVDDADLSGVDATAASNLNARPRYEEDTAVDNRSSKTVPNDRIYNAVVSLADADSIDLVSDISKHLTQQSQQTQHQFLADRPLSEVTIHDMDSSTQFIELAIDNQGPLQSLASGFTLRQIARPPNLSLGCIDENKLSLADIYDFVVQTWISSLSNEVPARTRIRLEGIARSLAASLWLSSHVLEQKVENASEIADHASAADTQHSSQQSLPLLEDLTLSSSQLPQPFGFSQLDSQLPTPSPTPSMASTSASTANAAQSAPNEAITRLSRYTTFQTAHTATESGSTPILNHWNLGEDPAAYDFRAQTAALDGTLNVAGSQMTAETYASQQRRVARREARRQQREAKRLRTSSRASSVAASVATSIAASSQADEVVSQPVPSGRAWQSSQPGAGEGFISSGQVPNAQVESQSEGLQMASQIQPGRHGARPLPGALAMRAKGKRKAGF
ncbi:hypothetical protein FH972_022202 [Carpinus fangiana]|uniref:Uncharacterized protein n=1 Tax=Carpinus fangiana TaxID=176857 RepID=A0A5N6KS40_9ROSI|nr:hypothetical protein FH972_022202 [Carpinus fangiana]